MKRSLRHLLVVAAFLIPIRGLAQDFTGTYSAVNDTGGETIVSLQQAGENLTGSIVGNGNTFELEGASEGEAMVGMMTGPAGALLFEAQLDGSDLYLTLVATDASGQPDFEGATTLVFNRRGGTASGSSTGASNPLASTSSNPLAPADPWVGTFSDGTLTLSLTDGGGSYSGTITLDGQSFEATVEGSGSTLTGAFQAGGSQFPVTLTDQGGGTIVLSTDGATYTLSRSNAGNQNPLASGGGGSNPIAGGSAAAAPQTGVGGSATTSGLPHDGTALGQEWYDFLAGKKATQMSSYSSGSAGGYSSRTDVHLCPNGQFSMGSSNSVSVDVGGAYGYGGGSGSDGGTWRVITQGQVAGVELTYGNGMVEQYRLDYQDGATYVNGERWYITPTDACGW